MKQADPSTEVRNVARAAAHWLALMESGTATDRDRAHLQQWRDSAGAHESAWQKVQLLRQRFHKLPSALAMATLDRPDPGRRALLKQALCVGAVVPTAWLLTRQLPLDAWRADLHTATGEHTDVPLADGSTLQLNTASAVNVDMQARLLTLVRGEMALKARGVAFFTIDARYGRITLSHSDVCVRLNAGDCQVSVVSGTVQVQPVHGAALLLREGQQVSLGVTGAGAIGPFDPLQPGWRERVLMAQNQPLGDFLRELSRYRAGWLRWEPGLETLRVTGSFQLDNTDRILSLLAATLPVQVQTRTRYWVTLVPRNNQA